MVPQSRGKNKNEKEKQLMLNVELVKGDSRIAFQVIQGGIAIAGKRVGGLDALHAVGQLAEFMSDEAPCPRRRFLKTSQHYLEQK